MQSRPRWASPISVRTKNATAGVHCGDYREGERAERGEVTLNEAAAALSVSPSTILRMLRDGTLPAQQFCKGAPWIIRAQDLERENVHRETEARRSRWPSSRNPCQKTFEFTMHVFALE